jgi:hypothetical protein
VRKCHFHKNQPARQQQIEQIQWLTAKTPRARREEEINKFTHRFLGVLGVFAVKIGVELNDRMQGTVTFWNDADGSEAILPVQAASSSVAMSAYRASAVPTGLPAHSSTQMLAWMIPPGAIGPSVRHSWPRSRYSRAPRGMDLQHAYIKMSADDDLSRKIAPRPAAGGAKIARWNRVAHSKVVRRIERLLRRQLWIAFF